MKNRKNVLIVFAVLAMLCLGIGYAALTDSLFVNTTVKLSGDSENTRDEELFDIEIDSTSKNISIVHATSTADYIEAYGMCQDKDLGVTLDVMNLSTKGDKIVATWDVLVVECEDGYAAKIDVVASGADLSKISEYISYKCEWVDQGNTVTLTKGQKATIQVTIEVIKTIVGSEDVFNGYFNFILDATAVKAN